MSTNPTDLVQELERKVLDQFRDSLAFSWLNKGVLGEVRQQGKCSCCWAFACTGSMESQYLIRLKQRQPTRKKKLPKIQLAPQELVDCFKDKFPHVKVSKEDENGCFGSTFKSAFNYAKEYGIFEEKQYPYKGKREKCRSASTEGRKFYVWDHERVDTKDPDAKYFYICENPIPCSIAGTKKKLLELKKLKDEVFEGNTHEQLTYMRELEKKLDTQFVFYHAVLIVGYGEEEMGKPYFLVKNSWGLQWGINGYGRIARSSIVGHLRRATSVYTKPSKK